MSMARRGDVHPEREQGPHELLGPVADDPRDRRGRPARPSAPSTAASATRASSSHTDGRRAVAAGRPRPPPAGPGRAERQAERGRIGRARPRHAAATSGHHAGAGGGGQRAPRGRRRPPWPSAGDLGADRVEVGPAASRPVAPAPGRASSSPSSVPMMGASRPQADAISSSVNTSRASLDVPATEGEVVEPDVEVHVAHQRDHRGVAPDHLLVGGQVLAQLGRELGQVGEDPVEVAVGLTSLAAVFSPTPGTPGRLSEVSPRNAASTG